MPEYKVLYKQMYDPSIGDCYGCILTKNGKTVQWIVLDEHLVNMLYKLATDVYSSGSSNPVITDILFCIEPEKTKEFQYILASNGIPTKPVKDLKLSQVRSSTNNLRPIEIGFVPTDNGLALRTVSETVYGEITTLTNSLGLAIDLNGRECHNSEILRSFNYYAEELQPNWLMLDNIVPYVISAMQDIAGEQNYFGALCRDLVNLVIAYRKAHSLNPSYPFTNDFRNHHAGIISTAIQALESAISQVYISQQEDIPISKLQLEEEAERIMEGYIKVL